MQKQLITPVLRIFDIDKAKAFYLDYLGFQIDWTHQFEENFPLYLQISKHGLILHLSEHYGDVSPGSYIRIYDQDIESLATELMAKNDQYNKPQLEKTAWETLELQILDPFSNRIVFFKDQ